MSPPPERRRPASGGPVVGPSLGRNEDVNGDAIDLPSATARTCGCRCSCCRAEPEAFPRGLRSDYWPRRAAVLAESPLLDYLRGRERVLGRGDLVVDPRWRAA